MTEKEYLDKIEYLLANVTEGNAADTDKQLDELFDIKPVRLIWFVAKAQTMLRLKKPLAEVFNILNGKMWAIYPYHGVESSSDLYRRIVASYKDIPDAKRHKYTPWICSNERKTQFPELVDFYQELENRINLFLDDTEIPDTLYRLRNGYFMVSNFTCYMLVIFWMRKLGIEHREADFVKTFTNFGYLEECVFSEKPNTFIIVLSENDTNDCEVVATILSLFGHNVYLILSPAECDVDYEVDMADTLSVSLENAQENDGVVMITPVELIMDGKSLGDNRGELIAHISKECTDNRLATLLCSGKLMDELRERPCLRKCMNRLSGYMSDGQEEYLAFGWAGDYLSYISMVYGFDARAAIEASAECDFSIVIPARNSAEFLEYSLKTCLNQRFKGSYEIVVSDNSTNGNTEVYELCKRINDPKIKYYRTPRDLHLPKSFEFAYLKAKGEFIFAIGSDDGVLPWGLEALSKVINENPTAEIIQWSRGTYMWPTSIPGLENQFVIPRSYKKNKFAARQKLILPTLWAAAKNKEFMYLLPMLYINSGFRRSYFKTLIDKTGYLWNGICQDVYMGVVTSLINKEILEIDYPVTIAGMSARSEGYKSSLVSKASQEEVEKMDIARKSHNIGGFCRSGIEYLIPDTSTDTSSLYNSILRAVAMGLIRKEDMENLIGYKEMFSNLSAELRTDDIVFDKKIHYFRFAAMKHSKEFLDWFDKNYYNKLLVPKLKKADNATPKSNAKKYKEEYSDNGGVTLDASKYGVKNIVDAVRLFEDKTGL